MKPRASAGIIAAGIVLLLGAALLQSTPEVSWLGVRPNLVLALLAVYAFIYADFFIYAAFVFIAVAIVGPAPGFSLEEFIFVLIAFAIFFLRDRFSMHPIAVAALLAVCGTFTFYLAVDPGFIAADFFAVLLEMVYNALVTAVCFGIAYRFLPYGKTSFTSF
jgi:hypothetical protein